MEFVGNKNEVFTGELPAQGKYPALKIAEFQSLFHYLSNETEAGILQQASVARIQTHSELKEALAPFDTLTALSVSTFDDEESALTLYKQAVFAKTASNLLGIQISNDTGAEAADRQEALSQKKNHCDVQARQAIDLLLHGQETICFEVA